VVCSKHRCERPGPVVCINIEALKSYSVYRKTRLSAMVMIIKTNKKNWDN
jgi:hypothetical protein